MIGKKLPCQYTRSGWDTTQAFNTRLNFAWPSGDDNSSSYWWQRGMSTSICKITKQYDVTVITNKPQDKNEKDMHYEFQNRPPT